MFSDDTTLIESEAYVNSLIRKFKKNLNQFEWCIYNKLDINWSKTYLKFVTNKRIVMPKEIAIRNVSK